MSRPLLIAILLFGLLVFDGLVGAQNPAGSAPKRAVHVVKYGSAKNLAEALSKHFKNDAEVQVVPEPGSNCLLITAPPATLDEMIKLIDQLDRRPRVIDLEVLIVEVASKKSEDGKPQPVEQEVDTLQLTGPAGDVMGRIQALRKSGQFVGLKRVQLTALENQQTKVMASEMKPYVTGTVVGGGGGFARGGPGGAVAGPVSNIIQYRDVGTIVTVTPQVTPDRVLMLDLTVEASKMHSPEDGVQLGTNDKGLPVLATEFISTRLTSKVLMTSGHAVLAEGVMTSSKTQQAQALIIVAARVVEPDGKSGK